MLYCDAQALRLFFNCVAQHREMLQPCSLPWLNLHGAETLCVQGYPLDSLQHIKQTLNIMCFTKEGISRRTVALKQN